MSKMKVKDLPEAEKKQLIEKMIKAGCQGVFTEYSVEAANNKIEQWEKSRLETSNEAEIPVKDENFDKEQEKNPPVPVHSVNKNVKKEKRLICHICRSSVINGKCTGCGFEVHRA